MSYLLNREETELSLEQLVNSIDRMSEITYKDEKENVYTIGTLEDFNGWAEDLHCNLNSITELCDSSITVDLVRSIEDSNIELTLESVKNAKINNNKYELDFLESENVNEDEVLFYRAELIEDEFTDAEILEAIETIEKFTN